MSGQNSYKRGKIGEELACEHLKKLGHQIIARNFRAEGGEIDIISIFENTVFFSEVKARKEGSMIPIEESITMDKRVRMQRAAQAFLSQNFDENTNVNYLFILLTLSNSDRIKKINVFSDFL